MTHKMECPTCGRAVDVYQEEGKWVIDKRECECALTLYVDTLLAGELVDYRLRLRPTTILPPRMNEDQAIAWADEFIQELAALAIDIGRDYSAKTYKARVQYLMHQDTLRDCVDGHELRKRWEEMQKELSKYEEQVPRD